MDPKLEELLRRMVNAIESLVDEMRGIRKSLDSIADKITDKRVWIGVIAIIAMVAIVAMLLDNPTTRSAVNGLIEWLPYGANGGQ